MFDMKIALFLTIISILFTCGLAAGDGCMIPYEEFDVYEPGQNAIIAWNGTHEKMILSVDSSSAGDTKALHIVPFPSIPEMELGSMDSFEKVEEILNEDDTWVKDNGFVDGDSNDMIRPVEIIHHEKIGPHDLTVTRVNTWQEFSGWVKDFLEGKGVTNVIFPEKTDLVVKNYLENNITYFAFDVVELAKYTRTVDPIIYTFTTERLYFPLEISSLLKGDCAISLALLTPPDAVLNNSQMDELGFELKRTAELNSEDVLDIEDSFHELFEGDALLSFFEGYFDLRELSDNVQIAFFTNVGWTYARQGILYGGSTGDFAYVYDWNRIEFIDIDTGGFLFEWRPSDADGNVYFKMMEEIRIGIENHILLHGSYSDGDFISLLDVDGTQIWFNKYDRDEKRIRFINTRENNVTVVISDNEDTCYLTILNISNGEEAMIKTLPYHDLRVIQQLDTGLFFESEGHFILLSLADGSTIWDVEKTFANYSSVYRFGDIDSDRYEELFLSTPVGENRAISMLDSDTGEQTILLEHANKNCLPVAYEQGLLILKSYTNIQAFDVVRRVVVWEYSFPEEYWWKNTCLFPNDGLITLYHGGNMVGLNITTGGVVWEKEFPLIDSYYHAYWSNEFFTISNRTGYEHLLVEIQNRIWTVDITNSEEVWNFSVDYGIKLLGIIEDEGGDSILVRRAGGIFSFRYEPNEMGTAGSHSYVYEGMEDDDTEEEGRGIFNTVSISVFVVILVVLFVIVVEVRR